MKTDSYEFRHRCRCRTQGHHDFQPYYARVGETWTKVDYRKSAREWMKPLDRGRAVDLVEITASWYLDDLPPMMFIKEAPKTPFNAGAAMKVADVGKVTV